MSATKRRHPLLKRLIADAALTGAALMIFALFHHVLPQKQESLNITIQNPYTAASNTEKAASTDSETESKAATVSTENTKAQTVWAQQTAPSNASGSRNVPTSSKKSSRNNRGSGSNGMNSKGGSAISGESETVTDSAPISEKFAEQYTDTVVITDSSYTSPDISISVSREVSDDGSITYYIADIYLRDITCFQTALANDTYGSGYRDSISDMAYLNQALLAVNGDYYGNTTEGVVIRNGVIYRANPTNCDVCVLYYDGSMRVIPGSQFSVDEAIEDGAWQAWTFGPALLDAGGETITSFNSTGRIISANPRTAIGYYEPGHYCLIVVDGRGESAGITLPELSELFYELGCKAAYNLDGGNSSIMFWQDGVINDPSGGGRESSDALIIAEVKDYA